MNRKEYYEQRNKLRAMRRMVFSGWGIQQTKDDYALEVLRMIGLSFNPIVADSIRTNQNQPLSIITYRKGYIAQQNSCGTRPVNVKKVGRK